MNYTIFKIVLLAVLLSACKSTEQEAAAYGKAMDDGDLDSVYAAYLSNRQVYFEYDSDTLRQL